MLNNEIPYLNRKLFHRLLQGVLFPALIQDFFLLKKKFLLSLNECTLKVLFFMKSAVEQNCQLKKYIYQKNSKVQYL